MTVHALDPFKDHRWQELLETHPRASIFHTPGWLEALRRSYGYKPIVFTTSSSNCRLTNGIPFCGIDSWLTGSRLVSVAFADHCDPLVSNAEELRDLLRRLQSVCSREKYEYIELRILNSDVLPPENHIGLTNSETFSYHELDLQPDLETLLRGLHPSCMQRKIRRAEREGLTYEEGTSDHILEKFYSLLLLTRRRHNLPPQPLAWFHSLRDCLGDAFNVRLASKNHQAIASIITLRFKDTLVYKYGCSDARFHAVGAMPYLFWQTIQHAKTLGLRTFDLGRSNLEDQGLVTFKDHLGARSSTLHYYRYPDQSVQRTRHQRSATFRVWSHMPDFLLKAAGNLLYRHVG